MIKNFFRNFSSDERGVTATVIAISMMALIAASGAAIDYARAQMVQAKLADTLDAAGLAAGSTLSTANISDVVNNYFNVNFPQGYLDATLSPVTVTLDATKTVLDLSATATVPSIIMGIVGVPSMTVYAETEIKRQSGGMELILVMDNTGSMAGSKLTALKTSATELINTLFGNDAVKQKLWVGLVPFSQAVNIGTEYASWTDATFAATLNWKGVPWAGCVDERFNGRDQTDDTPTTEKFRHYFWPDDSTNDWLTSGGSLRSGIGSTKGPNAYCPQRLLEMTNVKADILTAINSMQARGNTHVNVGAVWGFRMLSPKWRGFWGSTMASNSLPLDYGTPHMTKVVVLLTDGENTMSSTIRTAYGYLSEGRLGTTGSSNAVKALNTRTTNVCNTMKGRGIKVYTILYDLSSSSVATLMKNCASQPDYFFDTPTNEELHKAFQQIGDSLSNLRISK